MCKGGAVMGIARCLYMEELDRGLLVELNIKMKIFWGGCCKAGALWRLHKSSPGSEMFPFSLSPIVVLRACVRIILALNS